MGVTVNASNIAIDVFTLRDIEYNNKSHLHASNERQSQWEKRCVIIKGHAQVLIVRLNLTDFKCLRTNLIISGCELNVSFEMLLLHYESTRNREDALKKL